MPARLGASCSDFRLWGWQVRSLIQWDVWIVFFQETPIFVVLIWVAYSGDMPGFRCEGFRCMKDLRLWTVALQWFGRTPGVARAHARVIGPNH